MKIPAAPGSDKNLEEKRERRNGNNSERAYPGFRRARFYGETAHEAEENRGESGFR